MPCYTIQWESSFGKHSSSKWGNDADDALNALQRQHKSLGAPYKGLGYGKVILQDPQPFTPEARAVTDHLHGRVDLSAETTTAPEIEIHFGEEESTDLFLGNPAVAA